MEAEVEEVASVVFHNREYPVLINLPSRPGPFVADSMLEVVVSNDDDCSVVTGVALELETGGMEGQDEIERMSDREAAPSRPSRMAAKPRDMV